MICPQSQRCSGCQQWGHPLEDQKKSKIDFVFELFQRAGFKEPREIRWQDLPDRGLRDRLDFQIQNDRRGLWDQSQDSILDLPECLQLSPDLQHFLSDFRKIPLSRPKGSFRLRVSPQGQRGIWLDLANEDVKTLFNEQTTLRQFLELATVEVGQRRKRLSLVNDELKLLKESKFSTWTRTWIKNEPFNLHSRIADFSQVGDQANKKIIEALGWTLPHGKNLIEFGAGSGNLTFPALFNFESVLACEFDAAAADGFRLSLREFENLFPEKDGRLQLRVGDFQRQETVLSNVDAVLVNPPRSGVGRFLDGLKNSPVESLVYMSCFPRSMLEDMTRAARDWHCEKLAFIDQFPQTDHIEVLSLWRR